MLLFIKSIIMTREEALKIARKYGLENEVDYAMQNGYSPEEALYEWDIVAMNDVFTLENNNES